MPDFTMCRNTVCLLANRCNRSELSGTKPFIERQSWSIFDYDFESNNCVMFKQIN